MQNDTDKLVSNIKKHSILIDCNNIKFNYSILDLIKKEGRDITEFNYTHHTLLEKNHIAFIAGGMSAESLVSYSAADPIISALKRLGYFVTFIDMGQDIAEVLSMLNPDLVFNGLYGTYGEDGCLQGVLNILRIPYTGSGLLASAIAMNKKMSQKIFKRSDIPIIEHKIISKTDGVTTDPMERPYVIKPISQGSSIGVHIIMPEDDFVFSEYDFPYGDEVMVEKYVKGREFQIAVLNGKALGLLEIELINGKLFYDYEAKYTEGFTRHNLFPKLDEKVRDELFRLSELAYNVVGCRALARTEFIYDEVNDKLYILEINTLPGMTSMSICPEIAASVSINFDQLIEKILLSATFE